MWDDNGNIGKRYRRQDEIGTPYCVTIDFKLLRDGSYMNKEKPRSVCSLILELRRSW